MSRGLLLVERRARARDRVPVEEDPAARGGATDLLGLDEDLAPEERVHFEAAPGVDDRVRHQFPFRGSEAWRSWAASKPPHQPGTATPRPVARSCAP